MPWPAVVEVGWRRWRPGVCRVRRPSQSRSGFGAAKMLVGSSFHLWGWTSM